MVWVGGVVWFVSLWEVVCYFGGSGGVGGCLICGCV